MQRIAPFKTLDAFRGFAALWVVMVHSCDRWLLDGHEVYLTSPLYAFAIHGQLGVMLFFVISGYCITAAAYGALVSGKSVGRYGFERVRRIYPPYLAALALSVLSAVVIYYAATHHLIGEVHHPQTLPRDVKYWVANLFLVQFELGTGFVNVVFWSLGYEVAFYLLIGLFLWGAKGIARGRDVMSGTMFFVTAVGVSTAAALGWMIWTGGAIFPFDAWHQFSIGGLLFFLLEFRAETVMGYSRRLRQVVLGNVTLVVILTLVFAAVRQVGQVDIGHPSSRVRSLVCLGFAVALIGLRQVDERLAGSRWLHPLMWVGAFSYSLYLVHGVVLPFVDILCRKAGLNGPVYWVAFWIQVGAAVLVGWVFFVVVEKHFISKRQVQRLVAEQVVS